MNAGDSRVPPLYRFVGDAAAQSAPVGVVLLLAITVMGTGLVVGLGATALDDTRRSADLQRTEHAMTLLDSRGAMTALGESDSQRVRLSGSGGGTYAVHDDSGWLRVKHINHTGTGANETIYEDELGSLVYRNGDTRLAYEGGGVWRTTDDGTVMVSPPEFHFREATLVLPIIQIGGSGSASGSVNAYLDRGETARRIFPNATDGGGGGGDVGAPYDDGGANYTNPVENGTVEITVHSDHYRGWADYFRTRTEGNVSVNHSARLARVKLLTVSRVGTFPMPREGNGVSVRGMPDEGDPVAAFELDLTADNSGRNFENLHWSLYADEGDERFEIHFYSPKKCKDGSLQEPLDVSVYYWNTSSGEYEGWQNGSVEVGPDSDFSVDCDDYTLSMDLAGDDGGDTPMEYGDISMTGNDNKWYFGSDIKDSQAKESVAFDGATYERGAGDEAAMSDLINRYFEFLGPDFTLTVTDGPGGSSRIDEGASAGRLEYDGAGARYITYLHITENEVRIRLN